MWLKLTRAPWTPLLLAALLLSNLVNFVALQKVQSRIYDLELDQHSLQSDAATNLDAISRSLAEVSEGTSTVAACSKEIRPIWCRH